MTKRNVNRIILSVKNLFQQFFSIFNKNIIINDQLNITIHLINLTLLFELFYYHIKYYTYL